MSKWWKLNFQCISCGRRQIFVWQAVLLKMLSKSLVQFDKKLHTYNTVKVIFARVNKISFVISCSIITTSERISLATVVGIYFNQM